MMDVLRFKLNRLVRGDDGVALVITLALFMFLYVSAAGVFAVGQTLKDRIALQNAVDAAAYSAAIVEADTLSKIATINRAMAWTYKSMVCRQMDYVCKRFLLDSAEKYADDSVGSDFIGAGQGTDPLRISLSGGRPSVVGGVTSAIDDLPNDLESKILYYKAQLALMSAAVDDLARTLPAKMAYAAEDVLESNLPGRLGDRCRFRIAKPDEMEIFHELTDEGWFLQMADFNLDTLMENGDFNDTWFPKDGSDAIRRAYVKSSGVLKSDWWYKKAIGPYVHDSQDSYTSWMEDVDNYILYEGEDIAPLVLSKSYFGADDAGIAKGAVTVAVAMQNENPWERFIERSDGGAGFYGVFDPSTVRSAEGSGSWMWAVASAQAGYRGLYDRYDADAASNTGADYSLEYDDYYDDKMTENLRTPDWDAVFVPVRRAFDEEGFRKFMTEGWTGQVQSLTPETLAVYDATDVQSLPHMHNNNGAMNKLNWGRLLLNMFH